MLMTGTSTGDAVSDPSDEEMDWGALDALSDEDVRLAVVADPDARPLTQAQLRAGHRVPDVRTIRARLDLSQSEFATRFGFSTRTVQEWEQRRSIPNRGYRLYLHAIAQPMAFLRLLEIAPVFDTKVDLPSTTPVEDVTMRWPAEPVRATLSYGVAL
jgi:putative transcriptional regulator